MRRHLRLPVTIIAALSMTSLTGCTDRPYASPQEQAQNACQAFGPKTLSGGLIGTLGGAAGGAGIGALAGGGKGAAIGAGVGALAGLLGGMITGNQMDKQDCRQAQIALQQLRGQPTGQLVSWSNPATGSYGSYLPLTPETAQSDGQLCRNIRQNTALKGHEQTSELVKTCRTPQGDYVTVSPLQSATQDATPS